MTDASGTVKVQPLGERSKKIREWAKRNGSAVSDRGRLPSRIIRQYEATMRVEAELAAQRAARSALSVEITLPSAVLKDPDFLAAVDRYL